MSKSSKYKRRSTEELALEAARIMEEIKEEVRAEAGFFDDIAKEVTYSYLFKGIEAVAFVDYIGWARKNNSFEEATRLAREYSGQMAEQGKCMVKCPSLGLKDWVLWDEIEDYF